MAASFPPDYFSKNGLASTHWTEIRECAQSGNAAQAARERLCRDYWYPLYAYIKRSGHAAHDAEDLTQEFFTQLLRASWFARADQAKGKFRSFLFASLDNFLHDAHGRKNAQKRAGTYQHVPLDLSSAESRYVQSAAARASPVEVYETEWAATVVEMAWTRLRDEYMAAENRVVFDALQLLLTIPGDAEQYEAIAKRLGITADNAKVSAHRLRKRYGAILREEVARTVGSPAEIDDEMRQLRGVFAIKIVAAA